METSGLRIGAAVIHKGEEPPVTGTGGSGTIFISGCNLGCVFCQNYQISQGEGSKTSGSAKIPPLGKAVSAGDFADICAALRDRGAENINIVTGSHAVPGIIKGIIAARKIGVRLPVLWNSSGYDSIEALELLSEYVDIYLPDLKTLDSGTAAIFFNAPDYPAAAEKAVIKMIDTTGKKTGEKSKVIVRHLILPGYLESTRQVLRWFADNAKERALLSLMTQYTPIPARLTESGGKQMPDRYLSKEEYRIVINWLKEFKIEDGFCQELVSGSDWLPDFKRANPFSSGLSVPVF
jgi:putative pyruvate formate lyase activating enzyme